MENYWINFFPSLVAFQSNQQQTLITSQLIKVGSQIIINNKQEGGRDCLGIRRFLGFIKSQEMLNQLLHSWQSRQRLTISKPYIQNSYNQKNIMRLEQSDNK
ncbi:hypothetical protein FGO68_gene10914 [Halteria grandinella]|uniref:Uncharacterized protein n=1 Tax=Halteria grandinella TaxID=5974 RepID=A0A8J8NCL1_HALGN|nr:hypothetical protein FGO68_gene10914 [Halteria grandinella]